MKEELEQSGGGLMGEIHTRYLHTLHREIASAKNILNMFETDQLPKDDAWYLRLEGPGKYETMVELREAVLEIIQAFTEANVSISVIGLTHTMYSYSDVIREMLQFVREGKLDDALALYKQPRRYHR